MGKGGMLSAQKKLLEATVAETGAQLQQQELTYYTSNFGNMMTMASVIGGFAFSGILISTTYTGAGDDDTGSGYIDGSDLWISCLFYGLASVSVGACLSCALICLAVNVRGPGLALRGKDGSLKKSVDSMRRWQKISFYFLGAGVVAFHLEGLAYAWLMLHQDGAQLTVTIALGVFLISMVTVLVVIWRAFRIEGAMVQGMLSEDQFSDAYRRLAGQDYGATQAAEEKEEPSMTDSLLASVGLAGAV